MNAWMLQIWKNGFFELRTNSFEDSSITYIQESSTFVDVPEEIKEPKVPRRTNDEMAIMDIIVAQLDKKYFKTCMLIFTWM